MAASMGCPSKGKGCSEYWCFKEAKSVGPKIDLYGGLHESELEQADLLKSENDDDHTGEIDQ